MLIYRGRSAGHEQLSHTVVVRSPDHYIRIGEPPVAVPWQLWRKKTHLFA
jgi:hypothetical protein